MEGKYRDTQTFIILAAPPTSRISAKCDAARVDYPVSRRILIATHLVNLAPFDVHAASIIPSDAHNGVLGVAYPR